MGSIVSNKKEMTNKLVTIVSDQTIPNVLLIKELGSNIQCYIFLTTEAMEKKIKRTAIIDTCEIPEEKIVTINISEDKSSGIKKTLYDHSLGLEANAHYHVNITGGTKMMSLAVYEYFRNLNSTFYYLPIGKNVLSKFKTQFDEQIVALENRLTLHEYLLACGISYNFKEKFFFTEENCFEIFRDYKINDFIFEKFPVETAEKMSAYSVKPDNIRGIWFEEFVFYYLKKKLKLPDKMIACSVKVFKDMDVQYNDNEFDVMYVKDNELNVIECKVQMGANPAQKLDGILYKLGAINKNFGLKTNSFIYTLSDLQNKWGNYSPVLLRKCEVMNIKPPFDKTFFKKIINPNKKI